MSVLLTDDIHGAVQLVPGVLDDAELLEVDVHKRSVVQYLFHVILKFDELADLETGELRSNDLKWESQYGTHHFSLCFVPYLTELCFVPTPII